MRAVRFAASCALAFSAVALFACGEDALFGADPHSQGGSSPEPSSPIDVVVDDAGGIDDASTARWVFLTKNDDTGSVVSVVRLRTGNVDGRFESESKDGVSAVSPMGIFFIATDREAILRLNDTSPWTSGTTWALGDSPTGDAAYVPTRPVAVIQVSDTKAYAALYERNRLAVLDLTAVGTQPPSHTIDLSSYVSPSDTDGVVEAIGGYYSAPRKLLYVVLGSVDRTKPTIAGVYACTPTRAKVVAFDVATDQPVAFGDGGLGYAELNGYSQSSRDSVVYDPSGDRLLVLSRGCVDSGMIARREIEAVSLASGNVTTLATINDQPLPSGLYRIDANRVVIGFDGMAKMWDPASDALAAPIPGAPEVFTYNGENGLVGIRTTRVDGGIAAREVIDVPLPIEDAGIDASDAAFTVLQSAPFGTLGGTVSRVEIGSVGSR